ncbi:MAG: hypothetical protein Fur0021_04390 [Candidatus Promineifilaceae bacterium]
MHMKQFRWIFLWFAFFLAAPAQAQSSPAAIEQLTVDLWPDFDQPSVLVLLTGKLPASTPLPAVITVSVPAAAILNAVARITADGTMIDDVQYSLDTATQTLSITLPDLSFRVEYYEPYERNDLERQFTFTWQTPTPVQQLLVSVQQPAAATAMTVSPSPISVTPGNNGLQYHNMPATNLPANQPYTLDVSYTMSSSALTTSLVQPSVPTGIPPDLLPDAGSSGSSSSDSTLLLVGAAVMGVLVVGSIIWLVINRDSVRRPALAAPRRGGVRQNRRAYAPQKRTTPPPPPAESAPPRPSQSARFCHNCGKPSHAADRFCRYCGTELKQWE